MTILRLSHYADADVGAAEGWYQGEHPGLGDEFIVEVERTLALIVSNPQSYQIVFDDIRRALLRRFPYAVFYRLRPDTIEVIGILHHHIDPDSVAVRAKATQAFQ